MISNSIYFCLADKKEKWVPVDINITTKRPPGKNNRPADRKNSDSKNWREDAAKGKCFKKLTARTMLKV